MKVSMVIAPALIAVLVGGITTPTPKRNAPFARSTRSVTEATVEHGDFASAMSAAETAYRQATREARWESLIQVGDAYNRIAAQAGAPAVAGKRAWDAYEAALSNARRAERLDGVLRAAEGFAQLGDAAEVESTLHVARALAGTDPEAIADVKAAAAQLSDLLQSSRDSE